MDEYNEISNLNPARNPLSRVRASAAAGLYVLAADQALTARLRYSWLALLAKALCTPWQLWTTVLSELASLRNWRTQRSQMRPQWAVMV